MSSTADSERTDALTAAYDVLTATRRLAAGFLKVLDRLETMALRVQLGDAYRRVVAVVEAYETAMGRAGWTPPEDYEQIDPRLLSLPALDASGSDAVLLDRLRELAAAVTTVAERARRTDLPSAVLSTLGHVESTARRLETTLGTTASA